MSDQRPTILHVTSGLGVGGAETVLYRLMSAMRHQARWQHRVISLRDNCAFDFERLGVSVEVIDLADPMMLVPRLASLRRKIANHKPALIHGWMYHGAVVSAMLAPRSVPQVWGIHHSLHDFASEPTSIRLLVRAGAKLSQVGSTKALLFCSQVSLDHHVGMGYSRPKSMLIPNGFDGDVFRPDSVARQELRKELGVDSSSLLIGSFWRYHPVKNHRHLVQAFSELSAEYSDLFLVLAGTGMNDGNAELTTLLESFGVRHKVFLLGVREDMPKLYNCIDVYALTSTSEAFPNVLGEAACCGTVSVSTDVGDARLIVGAAGRVVPRGSAEEIASALRDLLSLSAPARAELGRSARAHVMAEFGIDAIVREYESVYSKFATSQ